MRGFKGFRKPEAISAEALKSALDRSGLSADNANGYVLWTGAEYKRRPGSLRSQALYTLNVPGQPVSLADWVTAAARCRDPENGIGFDPGTVRSGLNLHQGAKPCVYIALTKRADGAFVATKDVPRPGGLPGITELRAGDVVIPAAEKAEPAAVEEREGRVVETAASKARTRGRRR